MAKPGSAAARAIAGGAKVLERRSEMPETLAAQAQRAAETHKGMRCDGCGLRISGGIRFTRFMPEMVDGKPTVTNFVVHACNACDYANDARQGAHVAEMIEFVWFDENGDVIEPEELRDDVPAEASLAGRAAAAARRAASEGSAPADQ
jgi:hypothetical protein